ncbi:MAG: hypothetical protein IKL10_08140 [Clostridia bacterium]|nr:hypothetical protein [Clostridia bacterium]
MEKYKNGFFISGYIHGGIKSKFVAELIDMSNLEQENGVTYIFTPTYGILNSFGLVRSSTGVKMEVYGDK